MTPWALCFMNVMLFPLLLYLYLQFLLNTQSLYSYTVANIHMSKFKNMKHIKELRFKVCTKVKTKIVIFCVVTSYSLVCGYQLLPWKWKQYIPPNHFIHLYQHGPTGGLRPLLTWPAKFIVNLLLVTISSFISFTLRDLKKIIIFISSVALLHFKM